LVLFAFHAGFLGTVLFARKKEYAKLAIPLTGSKGQASGFLKKSPHLRYAPGSIF
jgi:hypothetical protein